LLKNKGKRIRNQSQKGKKRVRHQELPVANQLLRKGSHYVGKIRTSKSVSSTPDFELGFPAPDSSLPSCAKAVTIPIKEKPAELQRCYLLLDR